jgi:hypothetical protein
VNKFKKWSDNVVITNANLPLNFLLFFTVGALTINLTAVYYLLITPLISVSDKIVMAIVINYVFYLSYNNIALLINGRFLIQEIQFGINILIIKNALHKLKHIKYCNIKLISKTDEKWHLVKPHFYKTEKKGITIYLTDGTFLRISPHMERIDELYVGLEKIVKENNISYRAYE